MRRLELGRGSATIVIAPVTRGRPWCNRRNEAQIEILASSAMIIELAAHTNSRYTV